MIQRKKVALLLILSLVLTTFAGCGGGGSAGGSGGGTANYSAENPIVLRLASDAPLEHMATGLNQEAAEKVKERTEGRVIIQYFPASQLGGYETVYEEVMMGAIDMAQITVPDAVDARLGAPYLPYYATSFEEAKILYGPDSYMAKVMNDLTQQNDVTFLGFVLEGFIGIGTTKEPADMTPGAPKKIKTRTPAMATFRMPQEDLGYNAITVPYNEVPTAIQTKVVEGWVGGTPNMNYTWVGELIKHMYVNYIHAEATSYVISNKTLAKLTEEDRQILIDVFKEQSMKSFDVAQENEELYKKKLQEDCGVVVHELTPEEVKANAEYIRKTTWPKLESVLTKELMDGFRAEVEKLQQ